VVKLLLLGEARGEGDMTAGVGRRARPSGGRWIPARVYSWGDLHDNDNDESPFLSTIHEQDEEIKRLRDVIHGLKQAKEVDGSNDGSDDEKDQEQSVDDLRDEVEHLKTENEVLNDALSILREKFKNIEQKQKEELETETIEAKRRLDKVLDGDEEEIELIRRHRESFVGSVINKNEMLIAERDKAARENEVRLQILREVHERELKLSEENQELKHQVDDLRAQVNKQVKGFEEQIQILSDLHAEELKKQLEQSHAEFERQMDKVNMIEQEKDRLKEFHSEQLEDMKKHVDSFHVENRMLDLTDSFKTTSVKQTRLSRRRSRFTVLQRRRSSGRSLASLGEEKEEEVKGKENMLDGISFEKAAVLIVLAVVVVAAIAKLSGVATGSVGFLFGAALMWAMQESKLSFL